MNTNDSIDLGTATAAEMGTQGDVDLGTAQQAEMTGRRRDKVAEGVSLEIYQAKQQRLLNLKARKDRIAKLDKKVGDEITALEGWLLETMQSLNKDRDFCDKYTFSVAKSFQASIASGDADEAVPLLQSMGWTQPVKVNPSSLTSLIKGKMAEVAEAGYCDLQEIGADVMAKVMDYRNSSDSSESILDDNDCLLFEKITDEKLRAEVIAHVATPLELRPYLKTYTATKLSIRKSK